MCTYYYLHFHHVHPCIRPANYTVEYSFCSQATILGNPNGAGQNNRQQQVEKQPCAALTYAADLSSLPGMGTEFVDHSDPCSIGGCFVNQYCSSGGCRLEEVGGVWVCCHCRRGGNMYRCCQHPMKKVPDTLCYHMVCERCWADC